MFEPVEGWGHLPEDPANGRLSGFGPEIDDLSRDERVALGWTLLLQDRIEEVAEHAESVPEPLWIALGALDPEREVGGDDVPFGVIVYAHDIEAEGPERIATIRFDEVDLPVISRYGSYEPHAQTRIPGHGSLAWWVRASRRHHGWLTARHVAQTAAAAGAATILAEGRLCIDAAVVADGNTGGGVVTSAILPVAKKRVTLELAQSAPGRILDVAAILGIQASSWFPYRFSMNIAGVKGDSGSKIVDAAGTPVGIYLGAFRPKRGNPAGIGLALTQLEHLMQLEVYA